jgi:hypothetical protein
LLEKAVERAVSEDKRAERRAVDVAVRLHHPRELRESE